MDEIEEQFEEYKKQMEKALELATKTANKQVELLERQTHALESIAKSLEAKR